MTQKRPLSKDTPTLIKSERLILQIVPWISSSSTSSSSTLPQNWVIISNNLEPPSPSSGAAPSSGTTNRSSVMTNGNESGINSPSPSKSISSNPIEPLSPNPNPEQIQRPQAIPISFLVHPMHVSPQIPSINSIFDFPRTPSKNSSKSPSPSLPIEKELKKTQQQSSDSQSSPNEFSAVQTDSSGSANAASAKGHTPAGLNCTNFAHSTSNLPTDDCDGITLFNQLHGPTSPLGIRSNQSSGERKASKNPRDCLTRDESTSSTMKEDEGSSTPQISVRKTSNPNMKTTKTGKILHKPKKAGGNRKSTAYERFLQQRSKYLATHRSELTAQQEISGYFMAMD
ncbi:hypothetical protein BGX27_001504 [Mortierella sp. AM989]|nr:hypothetical protein BGX27_001504 [Mortierella sp. AM989]